MGEISNWSEVGGLDWQIQPYVRPPNSGSQQLMETIVMDGLDMPDWPPEHQMITMGGLIDMVRVDEHAIGYSVFYYVTHMVDTDQLEIVSVDGFEPGPAAIGEGTYPFRAPVYVVTRKDLSPDSTAAELRDWLLSQGGQDVVAMSEYVPILP